MILQTGESVCKENHIFGNPILPEICPVLAWSVLIFSKSRHVDFYRKTIILGGRLMHIFPNDFDMSSM